MPFDKVLTKIFGTSNERVIKKLLPVVATINALEEETKSSTDEQLRAKTVEFRARIAAAIEGITDPEEMIAAEKRALDEILPEAFAVVREAGSRAVGMRHFDVQMIGGMVLHQGKIAEMKTGEGKTLVATLPCYLNALAGHGVHVVTVNDYLAKRDAEWMGKIYGFLGLTVGVIVHDLSDEQRREAYGSDITYGTNNEFGFDYLRDNMKFDLKDMRAARPLLLHRRRSRLHPHRRSAHAAHHLRPHRPDHRQVRPSPTPSSQPARRGRDSIEAQRTLEIRSQKTWTGDFVVDEKPAPSPSPTRAGRRSKSFSASATSPTPKTGT